MPTESVLTIAPDETQDAPERNTLSRISHFLESQNDNLPPSAKLAATLHLYNHLNQFPETTEDDLNGVYGEIAEDIKREQAYASASVLPTLGLEVEIPNSYPLDPSKPELAKALGLNGYKDRTASWEYTLPPSASPWTQSLIIHEMIKGGFIPSEEGPEGLKMPSNIVVRIHLNFGIPEDLYPADSANYARGLALTALNEANDVFVPKKSVYNDQKFFANTFALAFSSSKRIWSANYDYESHFGKTGYKVRSPYDTDDGSIARFEIRALDIENQNFYRLLAESQRLAACFFDNIRVKAGATVSEDQAYRSNLWEEFKHDAELVYAQYNLQTEGAVNKDNGSHKNAARLMRDTNIKQDFRAVITKYSLLANKDLT